MKSDFPDHARTGRFRQCPSSSALAFHTRIPVAQNSYQESDQNPSKFIPKSIQKSPKMLPKPNQNRPQIDQAKIYLPDILPKSFQNPCKIFSKPTKIDPKSCPKSILNPKRVPKASRTPFFYFFRFFDGPRLPKIEPKSNKSGNRCYKNP